MNWGENKTQSLNGTSDVSSTTEGLTEHFNPGQCWSHGGGVTC